MLLTSRSLPSSTPLPIALASLLRSLARITYHNLTPRPHGMSYICRASSTSAVAEVLFSFSFQPSSSACIFREKCCLKCSRPAASDPSRTLGNRKKKDETKRVSWRLVMWFSAYLPGRYFYIPTRS